MKKFIRFYALFCLIVLSISCSEDDGTNSQMDEPIDVQFIRFGDNSAPNTIIPKTTYSDINNNRQVTSYFRTDANGNITSLSKLVGDDGSGLSTVIGFDQSGKINSIYQQNPITGEIFEELFVIEDNASGSIYFGDGIEVADISEGVGLSNFGDFLSSEDDLLLSEALNNSRNILDKFSFYVNNQDTSRASLNLGLLVIVAIVVYTGIMIAGSAVIVETAGESITCEYDNSCNERSTSNMADACSIPYTDFICSEVVSLEEDQCDDSSLEVIIGVDPGNLLVAIVNGSSANYTFYWSTGESDVQSITDSIVVTEEGNYYVIVEDDNGCFALATVTLANNEDIDAELLQNKTWYLTGETENGVDVFNIEACNITVEFTETQLIATEYYGESCETADEIISSYTVTGNVITETADGDSSAITILELTPYKMVLQEVDGDFTYVETYSNIFGAWTIEDFTDCESSDGTLFTDNGVGTFILNDDYTITAENDSNGNYIANSFTFENLTLTANVSYQDFFSPSCAGINFQTVNDTWTLQYNPATNSFSGSGASTANAISGTNEQGIDCDRTGRTCNSTIELIR
ncbi:MAG: hypothetical protein GYB32_11910 [Algicola sp.]|nr:hypothetical protein [Algicola sp.]